MRWPWQRRDRTILVVLPRNDEPTRARKRSERLLREAVEMHDRVEHIVNKASAEGDRNQFSRRIQAAFEARRDDS